MLNSLPIWVALVLDVLMALLLFTAFTQGARRGIVELLLTSTLLTLCMGMSYASLLVFDLIPPFPYQSLALVLTPLIIYITMTLVFNKVLFRPILVKLDSRDVPIWDALLGTILGVARGAVLILFIGIPVSLTASIIDLKLTSDSMIWKALTPIHEPIMAVAKQSAEQSLSELKSAQSEGADIANALGSLLGDEFEAFIAPYLNSTLNQRDKKSKTIDEANKILGQ